MLQPFYFILFYVIWFVGCHYFFVDISFCLMLVFGWHYIGLNCIVLNWTGMKLIALNYIALYRILLHCTALSWSFTALGCLEVAYKIEIVFCILLYCIALHFVALYCILLHFIAFYCIVSHCIALHFIVLKFHFSRLPFSCLKVWELYCIALHCIAFFALWKLVFSQCALLSLY